MTYSSSEPSVATVDENSGVVTIVAAGVAEISATFAGDDYYMPGTVSYTLNVGQKEVGLSWSGTTFTYDGNVHMPTATATGLIGSDACAVTVSGAQTNAGTYTATASGLSNGNYMLPAANTVSFTIAKAIPSVTAPTAETSLVYNGAAQALVNPGSTTGGTLEYSLDGNAYSTTIPTAINVGTYTVYYRVVGNVNYNDVVPQNLTVTIAKADVKVLYENYQFEARIGETFNPPYVTLEPAGLPLTYSSSDPDVASVDVQTGEVTLNAPGKVNIYAEFLGDENYNSASDYYVLTVKQANIDPLDEDVTITMRDEDFIVNGQERRLDNTIIYDILFTLNISGDPSESDGYDETDHSIVLNTPMSLRDVYYAITQGHEPGSDEYAEEFTGLTFKIPAGIGYVIIDSKTDGEHLMMVNIGDLPPVTFNHKGREKDSIFYECSEPTWVYVYNGGEVSSARMNAIPKAKKTKGHVKVYSVTRRSQKANGIEMINSDAFDETERWYDLQGNKINRPTKKGIYILRGQKVIVQ